MRYLDRTLMPISAIDFRSLITDEAYTHLRHYKSDAMRVKVVWYGGPFPNEGPIEKCRPFELYVGHFRTVDGGQTEITKEIRDEGACAFFRTAQEAINAYEQYLADNDGGEWVSPEHFLERGNVLSPEHPDTPAITEEPEQAAEFGSW